jgi:hypothetical protein
MEPITKISLPRRRNSRYRQIYGTQDKDTSYERTGNNI